ncbi:MAG: hypothetical protein ACREJL_00965 [Candidatus Methylomirabilales bacterium]
MDRVRAERAAGAATLVNTPNTYRQIAGADLPKAIPEDFRNKVVKALAIRSDTTSGFVLCTNFVRYEPETMELDEHPFMLFVLPENSARLASGGLIHHGDWTGRTTQAPPALVSALGSAFLGTPVSTLHPLATDPPHDVGPNEELIGTSHGNAFEFIFKKLTE